MKLTDLVKKENERLKTEVKVDLTKEQPKKSFKKERIWLEEKPLKSESTEITGLSDDNHMINIGQSYDIEANSEPNKDESYDSHMTNPLKDIGQSYDNHMIKFDWFNFSKLQQKILFSLFKSCKFSGSLITDPIRATELSEEVKSSVLSVRKTLFNIQKLGAIKRHSFKDGPGGYTRYILNKAIYDILILEEAKTSNHMIITGKSYDNHTTQPMKSELNSSNFKELNNLFIPDVLKKVISQKEIQSLLEKQLLAEVDLQQSLEHFAYDYGKGLVKAKGNPLNLMWGLLRSGKPYRSLEVLKMETEDLRSYQEELKRLEKEKKELKLTQMKHKFEEFKLNNPKFIETVALENPMASAPEVIEQIAFSKWSEQQ